MVGILADPLLKEHKFFNILKKSFLRIKTWSFSLLVWVGSFLQNVRDGRSLATSNRLTNLALRLLVHNLLLNCILLFFYILDQNFLRATSTFLMTEKPVGNSSIGISHTGLEVSGFLGMGNPPTFWVPRNGTRNWHPIHQILDK
jgi:hypothetical protein